MVIFQKKVSVDLMHGLPSLQMDGGDQECSQRYRPDEPAHTQRPRGDERKLKGAF